MSSVDTIRSKSCALFNKKEEEFMKLKEKANFRENFKLNKAKHPYASLL
jgi:hypothetical protein